MLVPSVPHQPLKPSLPAGHPNLLSITALFGSVPRPINFDKNKSSDATRERTFSASIHQTSAVVSLTQLYPWHRFIRRVSPDLPRHSQDSPKTLQSLPHAVRLRVGLTSPRPTLICHWLLRSAVPSPSRGLLVPVLFSVAGLPSDGLDLCSRPWFRPWLRPDAACVSSPL